jgi:hypothetical protein
MGSGSERPSRRIGVFPGRRNDAKANGSHLVLHLRDPSPPRRTERRRTVLEQKLSEMAVRWRMGRRARLARAAG